MIVVGGDIDRVKESLSLEMEKPTVGSLQLMKRECSSDPAIRPIVEWAGRCCLEGQTAGSGLLESAEASPPRFSGPPQFLAQTVACLTQRLGQGLISQ